MATMTNKSGEDILELQLMDIASEHGITWQHLMIEYIQWQDDEEALRQFIKYIKSKHNQHKQDNQY